MPLIASDLFELTSETVAACDAFTFPVIPPGLTDPTEALKVLRSWMEPGGPFCEEPVDSAEERQVPTPARDVPVRIHRHPTPRGVYLDIHGGGFIGGSPLMSDRSNRELADALEVCVVSVDYRLAPEHPFPAALDDCAGVAMWLIETAQAEFGTDALLIGGASAGGYLVATTLLRLRDEHATASRFLGASMWAGAYDLSGTPSHRRAGAGPWRPMFLGDRSMEEIRDAAVSPLYADLSGLPPATFSAGTADSLLDDSVFMAARWELAGNRADLAVYPEAPHHLSFLPVAMRDRQRAHVRQFLASVLDGR